MRSAFEEQSDPTHSGEAADGRPGKGSHVIQSKDGKLMPSGRLDWKKIPLRGNRKKRMLRSGCTGGSHYDCAEKGAALDSVVVVHL